MFRQYQHLYGRRLVSGAATLLCLTVIHASALASSWNPTLLVNTEAFHVIDDSDSSSDVLLKFGDTLAKTLTYERTAGRFSFNDDLYIQGNLDVRDTASGLILKARNTLASSGSLVWETVASGSSLFLGRSLSGNILHARTALRSSGSLTVGGVSSFEGALTFGDVLADTVNVNAATWTFVNDTSISLSGGVNGLSFDSTTLSIDATNDRVGFGTAAPESTIEIAGTVSGASLVVGGGTALLKMISASATLDFANIGTANTCAADLTITVPGAAVGDTVAIGVPNAALIATGKVWGWVSATNTVSLRYCIDATVGNPASGTFRATVLKF